MPDDTRLSRCFGSRAVVVVELAARLKPAYATGDPRLRGGRNGGMSRMLASAGGVGGGVSEGCQLCRRLPLTEVAVFGPAWQSSSGRESSHPPPKPSFTVRTPRALRALHNVRG